MKKITIQQYAIEVHIPAEKLIEKLRESGINKKSIKDYIFESDKMQLLHYLRGLSSGKRVSPQVNTPIANQILSLMLDDLVRSIKDIANAIGWSGNINDIKCILDELCDNNRILKTAENKYQINYSGLIMQALEGSEL
jgi:hypothetical protein